MKMCTKWCGRGCTKAEHDAALKVAVKTCRLLSRTHSDGWKPRLIHNMGWHPNVVSACGRLNTSISIIGRGLGYIAFLPRG